MICQQFTNVLKDYTTSILRVDLLFFPEDRGSIFLQHLGEFLADYMASHPRRQ